MTHEGKDGAVGLIDCIRTAGDGVNHNEHRTGYKSEWNFCFK